MKALVTGGAGFIGSHVAERLVRRGDTVLVLDDLSGGFRENVPAGAEFVQASVTDWPMLQELFARHRFDTVYHLAAYAAEGLSHFIRRYNYDNNVIGSINLVNLAVRHKVRCFVFTSSIAVYGTAPLPMTEETHPEPEDPYGIAKYAVEMDLKNARRMFGLDYVIFRPHNVYGERQNIGDKYRNVIGIFMNQILQGKPLTIFGDGSQTRAFSYIDDVAPAIANCVDNPAAKGAIFNIGGDTATTVGELARLVCEAMGVKPAVKYLQARKEVMHAYASHAKAARLLGVSPRTTLADGIGQMATWARQVGSRESRPFADIDIRDGLPEGW